MVGSETLAIVESSTCMKVPTASAIAITTSGAPASGGGPACGSGWRPGHQRLAAITWRMRASTAGSFESVSLP